MEVQTEIIRCEKCEFPAEDMNDLVFHMHEFYPMERTENLLKCNFCSDELKNKSNFMVLQKVSIDLIDKECSFGDHCWFRHASSPINTWREFIFHFFYFIIQYATFRYGG